MPPHRLLPWLLLLLASPAWSQSARLTARLDQPRLPVGAITVLRVFAELPPASQDGVQQIARWRLDLHSSHPAVANGRFQELTRPASDHGIDGSDGFQEEGALRDVGDSLLLTPNAGRAGPVELFALPITAYTAGQTLFSLQPPAAAHPVLVLTTNGTELPAHVDWSNATASLEAFVETEVPLPSRVRVVPTFDLAGQDFTLRFLPQPGVDHVVEFSDHLASAWHPLPDAPHNSGEVTDRPATATRFYRVRSLHASTHPRLAIDYVPRLVSAGENTVIEFFALGGWTHELEFRDAPDSEWSRWPGGPYNGGWIPLPGAWPEREFRIVARPRIDRAALDAFLIAGQSNGVLFDYGNPVTVSNVWKLDGNHGFVPLTRPADDPPFLFSYSFSVGAAEALAAARAHPMLIIPCAFGSTKIHQWMPGTNRFDRSSYFGYANFRRWVAAPHGLKALWYYGHESNMTDGHWLDHYSEDWAALIQAFRNECGPIPVIYAQVAKHADPLFQNRLHAGAEQQRLAESGQPHGLPHHHLVVTFDLPLIDPIHLSSTAQRLLGHRFALATRQHVYGEPVNGTGPRLLRLHHPDHDRSLIAIRFSRPINPAVNAYDHQFRVFVDGTETPPLSVHRAPDPSTVLITLPAPATGPVTVSYGDVPAAAPGLSLPHVVQDEDGLPTPQFGPLPVENSP